MHPRHYLDPSATQRNSVILRRGHGNDVVVGLPRLRVSLAVWPDLCTLHLSYPKEMSNTLEFIQKLLICLEE